MMTRPAFKKVEGLLDVLIDDSGRTVSAPTTAQVV
jgi:hypothetical protein